MMLIWYPVSRANHVEVPFTVEILQAQMPIDLEQNRIDFEGQPCTN
jgi:hypothetical protein